MLAPLTTLVRRVGVQKNLTTHVDNNQQTLTCLMSGSHCRSISTTKIFLIGWGCFSKTRDSTAYNTDTKTSLQYRESQSRFHVGLEQWVWCCIWNRETLTFENKSNNRNQAESHESNIDWKRVNNIYWNRMRFKTGTGIRSQIKYKLNGSTTVAIVTL